MMPPAHLLYAVALLVSYAATFGFIGFSCGIAVLGVWAFVFYSTYRPRTLGIVCLFAFLGLCLLSMPTMGGGREVSRRSHCKNNLKQIGLALHNYHDVYGSFPPAFVADETGKPMHSWRVLLLPYLDQQALSREYDFSEPWDSPENLKLLDHMPLVFACPSHASRLEKPKTTGYLAIVGPRTAWPGSEAGTFSSMKDGISNTIMVVEDHSSDIPWTEPRDLNLEKAATVLASQESESYGGHRGESFFYEYFFGRNVLFADGRVQSAPFGLDRTLAMELMTIDDGKPDADWDWIGTGESRMQKTKWGNVIRFAVLVFLTVLPLPWVWLHPRGTTVQDAPSPETPPGNPDG